MPHGFLEISDEEFAKHLAQFLHMLGYTDIDLDDLIEDIKKYSKQYSEPYTEGVD